MRRITPKLVTLALLSTATAALPACSKKAPPDASVETLHEMAKGGDETITREHTPDGGSVARTINASATVTAIDPATRTIKLRLEDGSQTAVKCGPQVRNFSQIKVNDKVNVTMTEALAIYLDRGDAAADGQADGQSAGVSLAPAGAKPMAAATGSTQVTGKITAIDPATRMVTLRLPDGSSERVKAGEQIDLSAVKPGDDVIMRHTTALAVSVETP
jgi:hypothetical protein